MERLAELVPPERLLVATTERLVQPIRQVLPHLRPEAILIEPFKRDTAPCIGLAALQLLAVDPQAVMVVAPSDHVIQSERGISAGNSCRRSTGGGRSRGTDHFRHSTVLIRLRRSVISSAANSSRRTTSAGLSCFRVKQFCEKPSRELAQAYVQSGSFYWNAGIFVWRAQTIWEALARYAPDVYQHLETIRQALGTPEWPQVLRSEFAAIRPISIDYAVMQNYPNTLVIEAPFKWDDLGNWRALERLYDKDLDGNTLLAERHLCINARGNIVRTSDPRHLIVLVGVEDLVVVCTPDATLVARKEDEEALRRVVPQLADLGWTEYL